MKEREEHLIIETSAGEVMLKQCFDVDTQETFCDAYIGNNYDDYIGEVHCTLDDDEEYILEQVENLL